MTPGANEALEVVGQTLDLHHHLVGGNRFVAGVALALTTEQSVEKRKITLDLLIVNYWLLLFHCEILITFSVLSIIVMSCCCFYPQFPFQLG